MEEGERKLQSARERGCISFRLKNGRNGICNRSGTKRRGTEEKEDRSVPKRGSIAQEVFIHKGRVVRVNASQKDVNETFRFFGLPP